MRFIFGVFVGFIWCVTLWLLTFGTNYQISNDTLVISTAIIVAGAMAGEK